jgi:hypothetical protein
MHARTVTEVWHGELMIMILPGDLGARAAWIPPGAGDLRAGQLPGP